MNIVKYETIYKNGKFILMRYIFKKGILQETFWVNSYYDFKDLEEDFNNIISNCEYHKWNIIFTHKNDKGIFLSYSFKD